MANPLHRMVSSSQVSEWFGQGTGNIANPSRIGKFPQGTGGTINTYIENGLTYYSHTFTSSETFTALVPLTVEYCVVASGGSGAGNTVSGVGSAGCGAGGMRVGSLSITAGAKVVTIGAQAPLGSSGSQSTFDSISCTGGGTDGASGGSGGGGAASNQYGPGAGIAGQGNNGGSGAGVYTQTQVAGGGGGGKTSAGTNATGNTTAGLGGAGLSNNYSTGIPVIYATGGRGGQNAANGTGPAGVNPGDGGGGGNGAGAGTLGSAGIVIIRYVV